ncbi:MAG: hypothetical protein JXR12_06455 [Neptunomonas phycophila]|uniref:hypothetical protein n=1 Tax=Neptunomonas phycophila TaxID=1572645 RepID=UPI003B8E9CB9
MHEVKLSDDTIVHFHRADEGWQLQPVEDIELTVPKDTRPISQICITEFVKPKHYRWLEEEIKIDDEDLARLADWHKKFVDKHMQSVGRGLRDVSEAKTHLIDLANTGGIKKGDSLLYLSAGRSSGKSMIGQTVMRQMKQRQEYKEHRKG